MSQPRQFGKLSVVAAVVAASCLPALFPSSASADATGCNLFGSIRLAPGLSEQPQVQVIHVSASLLCGGEASEGHFNARLMTAEPVSCAALRGTGAISSGSFKIGWVREHEFETTKGSFSMPLTEMRVNLGGTAAPGGGPFSEDQVSGTVWQEYSGAASCGISSEHKKAKKVRRGVVQPGESSIRLS